MQFWQYALLFLTVLAGGGIALRLKKYNPAYLKLVLSFTGAYILGISILHLLPSVFADGKESTGLWILSGFFLQLVLEQLTRGVEHGHMHSSVDSKHNFAMPIMLGLCLHAFIEGLPLNDYEYFHQAQHGYEHNDNHLFFGIIIHKAPAAFALAILLLWSKTKQNIIWLFLIIFASMSPLGALTASLFSVNLETVTKLVALVIGSFLHISTTILFEADDSHQHSIPWRKMAVILAGLGIAILTL